MFGSDEPIQNYIEQAQEQAWERVRRELPGEDDLQKDWLGGLVYGGLAFVYVVLWFCNY